MWDVIWSCGSCFVLFFEIKCACLPDRVLFKFFCWDSVYSADSEGKLSDNSSQAKRAVVQFSCTSLFPSSGLAGGL